MLPIGDMGFNDHYKVYERFSKRVYTLKYLAGFNMNRVMLLNFNLRFSLANNWNGVQDHYYFHLAKQKHYHEQYSPTNLREIPSN